MNALKRLQKCEFRSVKDEMCQGGKCLKPQTFKCLSQSVLASCPWVGRQDAL